MATDFSIRSTRLCILVRDRGETKAGLSFGVTAIDNLSDLIPEQVRSRLSARGVNLATLAHQARSHGFPQGDLFSYDDGIKSVRVWLE